MKKIYIGLLVMLSALLVNTAGKTQTITNVQLQDSCNSNSYNIMYFASISAASANQSLLINWGDGTTSSPNLGASQTTQFLNHIYSSAGTYTIMTVLYKNSIAVDTHITSYTIYCSHINIKAYLDNNNNCVLNTGEPPITTGLNFEVDSAGVIIDTISIIGSSLYKAKPGTIYKFKILNPPVGTSATCPSSGIVTITGPAAGSTTNIHFGFQCGTTSQFDLGIAMTGMFRPVGTSTLVVHAYNNSCGSKSGVVTVNLNSKYVYKNANITPASVSGNTITWNVNNLSATGKTTIYIYADTATGANVQINDTICNTASITPTSGDVNTANNTIYQCDRVRASWDPNDKHVYPAGDIAPGTKLTYTINFENLGNDTAFNIYIMDTLSDRLDAGSLQLLTSSHTASHLMLDAPGGKKVVRFDFKDIYLPDKNSPNFNKGFVQFSINVKNGLAPSTPISNRAGIYFDINPVVITNYAENRINPVSINDVAINNQVTFYPNPVTDVLTIQVNNGGYDVLRLLNNMGQVVSQQNINDNTTTINMAQFPTGMYYLQLTGKDNTITQKIEKH